MRISQAGAWFKPHPGSLLFDLQSDPRQERPLTDPAAERRMIDRLVRLMHECEAPAEQYERLGLPPPPSGPPTAPRT